jgi:hypothetical protein
MNSNATNEQMAAFDLEENIKVKNFQTCRSYSIYIKLVIMRVKGRFKAIYKQTINAKYSEQISKNIREAAHIIKHYMVNTLVLTFF